MMLNQRCLNCTLWFLRPYNRDYRVCGLCKSRLEDQIAQGISDAIAAVFRGMP